MNSGPSLNGYSAPADWEAMESVLLQGEDVTAFYNDAAYSVSKDAADGVPDRAAVESKEEPSSAAPAETPAEPTPTPAEEPANATGAETKPVEPAIHPTDVSGSKNKAADASAFNDGDYSLSRGPLWVGGFQSEHPGGANFLFGDGAVQFISEMIDLQVYRQLGHRADGKLLNSRDY